VEFTPGQPFKPGETVFVMGSSQVQGGGGEVLIPYTWQFTAAAAEASGVLVAHPTVPAFGAGSSQAVSLADLDGDGDLDAVVANEGDGAETVWLNGGDGVFAAHGSVPQFGAADSRDVALGDLDGDGDLDAVVANNNEAETVWLNDGTGAFSAHGSFGGGTDSSQAVALGDLDGDGDLDAAVAGAFGVAETVWVNDGSGSFAPHPVQATFNGSQLFSTDVVLGDLDGDGDLDAVVSSDSTGFGQAVWLNDGTGVFVAHPSVPEFGGSALEKAVELGDLDGDGDLDAVVAVLGVDTVWLNDGSGAFAAHPSRPTFGGGSSTDLALGDLDGDGDLDAVVANWSDEAETLWLNDGSGALTAHTGKPAIGAEDSWGVALGDLDGDGDLDAVVANSTDESETVWLNEFYSTYLPVVISNWP
jgi:hypothetical protein